MKKIYSTPKAVITTFKTEDATNAVQYMSRTFAPVTDKANIKKQNLNF